jgi:hypothetical protein
MMKHIMTGENIRERENRVVEWIAEKNLEEIRDKMEKGEKHREKKLEEET